jgi:zinc transporter ZupT
MEALALALSIYGAHFSTVQSFLYLGIYSLLTPVGIVLGIFLGNINGAGALISAILISIAAGSFFYISLIEIIPTELGRAEVP